MAEGLEVRSLLSVGLDPSFGFGGIAAVTVPGSTATSQLSFSPSDVSLQNGQVVAVGTETTVTYNSSGVFQTEASTLAVARLTTGGTLDPTFGTNGIEPIPAMVTSGGVTYSLEAFSGEIAVQSNGQIVLLATATSASGTDLAFTRLNANGGIDTSFGTSGYEFNNFGPKFDVDSSGALTIGPDGKIVGSATVFSLSAPAVTEIGITRLNTNGSLDTSFNTTGWQEVQFSIAGTPADTGAAGVVVQPNLAIVVVGSVTPTTTPTPPVSNIGVARLTVNGTLDTSFNSTGTLNIGGTGDDSADDVTLEGTQIVIAGTSTVQFQPSGSDLENVTALTVTRLNSSGSFDTSFNGTGTYTLALTEGGIPYSTSANDITVLPDGTLLAGGSAGPDLGFAATGMLVNLTSSGSLNTSYGSNGVALIPETPSGRLLVQADGKVVFNTGGSIVRTTAPVPQVASTSLVMTGTGKRAKVTAITLQFNTSVNPSLASNVKLYQVRVGQKGKNFLKIKRVTYNASMNSLTIQLSKPTKISSKGYQVLVTGSGIIEASGEILDNGSVLPVNVSSTPTPTSARRAH